MSYPITARTTTVVTIGTPSTDRSPDDGWETVEAHFLGFEDLPSAVDESVDSPEFSCLGYQWSLRLFPGGTAHSFTGYAAIYLKCCSNGYVDLECGFSIKSLDGKQVEYFHDIASTDDNALEAEPWGNCEFALRSDIARALTNGTLIVEVRMKHNAPPGAPVPPFIPKNPLIKHILERFNDEETADVLFEVGGGCNGGRGARKKAKTTPVSFRAHRLILQDSASTLYELSKATKDMTPIQISDVKPDIFNHMLRYVYGGDVPEEEMNANAEEIIDAADKYGVVNLKLEAEACYAKSVELTVDNVIDTLLYAESKNCALLKEVAMDYIAENGKDVMKKVCFDNVPGTMMKDLLAATTRREDNGSDNDDYSMMRVSTLRRKLHEKGLDVDGSREAMIALLEEHS